jgi:hypothetical protein
VKPYSAPPSREDQFYHEEGHAISNIRVVDLFTQRMISTSTRSSQSCINSLSELWTHQVLMRKDISLCTFSETLRHYLNVFCGYIANYYLTLLRFILLGLDECYFLFCNHIFNFMDSYEVLQQVLSVVDVLATTGLAWGMSTMRPVLVRSFQSPSESLQSKAFLSILFAVSLLGGKRSVKNPKLVRFLPALHRSSTTRAGCRSFSGLFLARRIDLLSIWGL